MTDPQHLDDAVAAGLEAMRITSDALEALVARGGDGLRAAAGVILDQPGRVLVTGLGKSGLVGAKIAATMASTGTVASFVHSADALHGDAGMVAPGDTVIALSNSGETAEVCAFASMVVKRGIPVISITGCGSSSRLSSLATVALDACIDREADPNGLAPTASTSVAIALGDALAITLMVARRFGPEDFRRFHPGGALGAKLDDE